MAKKLPHGLDIYTMLCDVDFKFDDIKDEIWDMISPKNPNYFTLQDVLASPYRDLVLWLLIDARAFYMHDQKEFQMVEEFVELDEDYL